MSRPGFASVPNDTGSTLEGAAMKGTVSALKKKKSWRRDPEINVCRKWGGARRWGRKAKLLVS